MRRILLACMGALGLSAPAAATVYTLSFDGSASFVAFQRGQVTDQVFGIGRFDLDDALTTVSLTSGLREFSFTTYLSETVRNGLGQPTAFAQRTVSYGLSDLQRFDATVDGGRITSLRVITNPVHYTSFSALGQTGYQIESGAPPVNGTVTAAVPEPGSWTFMLAGFGALGCALRRRSARGRAIGAASRRAEA